MHGLRAEHNIVGLSTSRWLEALWEPGARLYTLPNALDMLDVTGDGDARLICADLGAQGANSTKIRVYKGGDQITEHSMMDLPCGVVGFYTENGEPRSSVLAVGASSSVYIFKNMRPYFKYCLPTIDVHPKEREIWHKASSEEELNVLTLADELDLLLKELGAAFISPRTLKFLSMDPNLRFSFAEQYKTLPLVRSNALSAISVIRRDSWTEPASGCLVLGTESGEVLVLDSRTFSVMDKHLLEWPPVAFACTGLWTGDGRILIIGRDGKIGAIRRGSPVKLWEKLPSPAVAISTLSNDGVAVTIMDGTLIGLSRKGIKLWHVQVPGAILDLVSLPVPQIGLSLLAVSTAGYGIRVYDGKHHVDTLKIMEPVSAMKYGRMGQEERTMAMVTVGGGLCVKILKRTADFSTHNVTSNPSSNNSSKFLIPKKTRLFVEQTIRERSEAKKIHSTFQQGLLRLRLMVAKKAVESLNESQNTGPHPITLEATVLGLGPNYQIRILLTNISDELSDMGLYIVCRNENTDVRPRVMDVPLLPSGIPIPMAVHATLTSRISGRVQILLCKKSRTKPITVATVVLPAAEEEIEV
ncbi:Bardet-Biedl syndrome 1 protein homolog isoform X1 [Hylaeus anthracinus]|uniref:Bardet-Biedl syndrome 1 protein homolog isoform X1 n=1 Tax=Hylaeus volcanicus TaxID=313075 RepID=UPI0023B84EAA|nr:Bardet-Biedl syndrome 1 protein homolog isoform X1 [Hylaeus volcanicus]XP_054006544.1 Bardet-Biedl syndrome 1 protein homolog isoform X1 [Hylaeus anthracinus]